MPKPREPARKCAGGTHGQTRRYQLWHCDRLSKKRHRGVCDHRTFAWTISGVQSAAQTRQVSSSLLQGRREICRHAPHAGRHQTAAWPDQADVQRFCQKSSSTVTILGCFSSSQSDMRVNNPIPTPANTPARIVSTQFELRLPDTVTPYFPCGPTKAIRRCCPCPDTSGSYVRPDQLA